MKLKKLFAGIVAVAMMATMAIPGFAATDAPTPKIAVTGNTFTINKEYKVTGTAPSENFKLTQTRKETSKSEISTEEFKNGDKYALTINDAAYTSGSKAKFGFNVTLPNYDNHPGIYVYTLKEDASAATAGVTYDSNTYTLTVYATQAANENDMTAGNSLNYSVRLDVEGTHDGDDGYKVEGLTNTYKSHTVTVTKKVKGNLADRQKDFYFKVTFGGTIAKMAGTIKVNGTTDVELDDENSTTFSLKHGKSEVFSNVPDGVTVTVVELTAEDGDAIENNTTSNGYKVTYNTATTDSGDITATITNDSEEHVDTGVILDNAPYIALLTIVAAGAVVMIMKKRRNYED